jgi:hypothetical protein
MEIAKEASVLKVTVKMAVPSFSLTVTSAIEIEATSSTAISQRP